MPEIKEVEARLDQILKNRPDLQEAAALQRDLLRESYGAAPRITAPELSRERVREKLSAGVPLLHAEEIDPDVEFCRDLFGRLLNVLQRRPESSESAAEVAHAAAEGRLDFDQALDEALANHGDHLYEVAAVAGAPADALASVFAVVVQPSLQALGEALKGTLIQEEAAWERGYCPVCGAWPGLAELQLGDQHRHLRCLRCGADWPTRRMLCVFCGNDDHRTLGYLQVERELRCKVEVCEQCKGYLKTINAYQPSPPEFLVLDDLASVHLDVAALERDYLRPPLPGFRIELGGRELPAQVNQRETD
jgi:FdhE protein